MKQITYTKAAIKTQKSILANTAKPIWSKIEAYEKDPASQTNNVKAMQGRDAIRLRVGDWRVIMAERGVDVDQTTLNRWGENYARIIPEQAHPRKAPTGQSWRMPSRDSVMPCQVRDET